MEQLREFSVADIIGMLKQTKVREYAVPPQLGRKMSLHTSDGYRNLAYRTTFFCVEGSPNKVNGWIMALHFGFKMSVNCTTYYFNRHLNRVSLLKLQVFEP